MVWLEDAVALVGVVVFFGQIFLGSGVFAGVGPVSCVGCLPASVVGVPC